MNEHIPASKEEELVAKKIVDAAYYRRTPKLSPPSALIGGLFSLVKHKMDSD